MTQGLQGGMLSPLSDSIFAKLFAAQVVALLGTGLASVALALLAWELAGEQAGMVLGTALALKMVAYVVVSPLVGGWLHRVPRKALLISLDILRALLVLCLPFISEIWQIYVVIFLLNACSAGFTPAFQATIPTILPDEAEYTKALSLSRLAYDLENLLSPALAAALLLVMSYSDLFVLNAVGFFGSAVLVASAALAGGHSHQQGGFARIRQGLKTYLGTPRLRALLALSAAVAAGGAMVIVNTVVYVQGDLAGNASLTALVLAASGAGSMLAALLTPRALDKVSDRHFMLAGGVVLSVGLLLGISEPGIAMLLPAWFVLGFGSSMVQTPAGRLLTRSAAEAERPMLFAAQFALSHGCWLLAYPLAGWLGGSASFGTTCGVLAALALASVVVAWRLWWLPDDASMLHEHAAVEHVHEHVHDEHHQHDHAGVEAGEPHSHPHRHEPVTHRHPFVIDLHHPVWPR